MGVIIGIVLLGLLVAGLVSRKRSAKAWVKEERYEESGNWIDKRAGERGTWGSLDAEMTQERGQLLHQGRAVELAEIIRQYAMSNVSGFSELPDDELRSFRSHTRNQATQMVTNIEQISKGKKPSSIPVVETSQHSALKKQILDFAYHAYPALLDLDIDTIRQFDQFTGHWVENAIEGLGKLKA